jgi:PadR family transcriptional regulator PadR
LQGTKVLPIFARVNHPSLYVPLPEEGQEGAKRKRTMNIENAKSQMRKGMLEYCVLLLLKHRPSYASDIIQQLKRAELLVVEGTLYPLLTRLKNDGLLRYEWQESTQGPPRKYYALSTEGEQFLEGLDAAWTELSNTINYLKTITPKLLEEK